MRNKVIVDAKSLFDLVNDYEGMSHYLKTLDIDEHDISIELKLHYAISALFKKYKRTDEILGIMLETLRPLQDELTKTKMQRALLKIKD